MNKKLISKILILTITLSSFSVLFYPKKSQAQFVVNDPLNFVQNTLQQITGATDLSLKWKDVVQAVLEKAAKVAAQQALKKITKSTVNWINSGYDGAPLYVQNPKSFFGDIADQDMKVLIDKTKGDFYTGRDVAVRIVTNGQKDKPTLENTLRKKYPSFAGDGTNPNELSQNFENDFSVGGLDGWLALTQNDANNTIGATFKTESKISRKINEDVAEAKDKLNQAGGFLGVRKCDDPEGYTKKDDLTAPDSSDPGFYDNDLNFDNVAYQKAMDEYNKQTNCENWVDTTPGSVVGSQITTALTSKTRQTELSQALGGSISQVFDALIGSLLDKGLSALSGGNSSGKTAQGSIASLDGTTIGDPSQSSGSNWYDSPDTSIDIDSILLPYKDENDKTSTVDNSKTVSFITKKRADLYKQQVDTIQSLPTLLKDLDSCIPGPDKGWEQRLDDEVRKANTKKETRLAEEGADWLNGYISNVQTGVSYAKMLINERQLSLANPSTWGITRIEDMIDSIARTSQNGSDIKIAYGFYLRDRSTYNTLQSLSLRLSSNPTDEERKDIIKKYLAIRGQVPTESSIDEVVNETDSVIATRKNISDLLLTCNANVANLKGQYKDIYWNYGSAGVNGQSCSNRSYAYGDKVVGGLFNPIADITNTVKTLIPNDPINTAPVNHFIWRSGAASVTGTPLSSIKISDTSSPASCKVDYFCAEPLAWNGAQTEGTALLGDDADGNYYKITKTKINCDNVYTSNISEYETNKNY